MGVPHPTYGETVAAFVVLKSGITASEQERRQFAAQKIADYKIPEQVTFLSEFPRGLTGKVQRKALKDLASRNKNRM